MTPFDELTEAHWDLVLSVNVKGLWHMIKSVVPQMRRQGGGRIVNVASNIPQIAPPLLLAYTASKGAVQAMTRALAKELGDENIRVTGISPGITFTQATKDLLPDPIMGDMFLEQQAVKEQVLPENIAPVVVFLCCPESDAVVGQNFTVDNGFTTS
jgi:NAD(P)-dependent dehydrogenase (short-subunit alcohol dehydrogenase family)